MRDYFYRIEGYQPREHGLGRAGFSAYLDREFAHVCHQTKMPRQGKKNLEAIAKSALHNLFGKDRMMRPPYQFVDDSLLLRYIVVPGDACELGIDGGELGEFKREEPPWDRSLAYTPHNVDTHTQAYALLSLFLTWADIARAVTMPSR
jgi:hypothetical protein